VDFGLDRIRLARRDVSRVLRLSYGGPYATQEHFLGDESLFEFANTLMAGCTVAARPRARGPTPAVVVMEGGTETLVRQRTGRRCAVLAILANIGPPAQSSTWHR